MVRAIDLAQRLNGTTEHHALRHEYYCKNECQLFQNRFSSVIKCKSAFLAQPDI